MGNRSHVLEAEQPFSYQRSLYFDGLCDTKASLETKNLWQRETLSRINSYGVDPSAVSWLGQDAGALLGLSP